MENSAEKNTAFNKEALLKAFFPAPPKTLYHEEIGRASIDVLDNHLIVYRKDGEKIHSFYSSARTTDGTVIDIRAAELTEYTSSPLQAPGKDKTLCAYITYRQNGLDLLQSICLYPNGDLTVGITLSKTDGSIVSSRYLVPFAVPYPSADGKAVFLSLDQKMLCVPYDNDMWARYGSVSPGCGITSYDVTAVYDEKTFEGLIVGALDFNVWKNAIRWSRSDARSFYAFCGAADSGTHDSCPHAPLTDTRISSSRFLVFWTEDVRRGMEHFGDVCRSLEPRKKWTSIPAPFGWNSYSALGLGLTLDHWQEAGHFLNTEVPNFHDITGTAYVNLDGAFGLDTGRLKTIVDELHSRGQKAGWYANPCNWFEKAGNMPAKGTGLLMKDLFLKNEKGEVLPANDGTVPLDVTLPAWEQFARRTIRDLVSLDIDYIKLDFLSHGSLEGAHYLSEYTGRMALDHAYTILNDEIQKADHEIFVSLSIAPLFPFFFGDARRCCCDSFGHSDDTRYVLNALNFAWWTQGRLYSYNDPDHIPLYSSVVDGRCPTLEVEAKSRYTASVISGTVMLLSDNYGPFGAESDIQKARSRTIKYAGNEQINVVARLGIAFVPVSLGDGTADTYIGSGGNRRFIAFFNFTDRERNFSLEAAENDLPEKGSCRDLWDNTESAYSQKISLTLPAYDCSLMEVFSSNEF